MLVKNQKLLARKNSLIEVIKHVDNKSLGYYGGISLVKKITDIIVTKTSALTDDKFSEVCSQIESILKTNQDFRIIADFLSAIDSNNQELIKYYLDCSNASFLATINHLRFLRQVTPLNLPKNYQVAQSVEDLFSQNIAAEILVYFVNSEGRESFLKMYEKTQGLMSEFIECQYDLPGLNCQVRKGLVKSIILNDKDHLISKRDNPDKKGRFLTEQLNIKKLLEVLNLLEENSAISLASDLKLKLLRPLFVIYDRKQSKYYSISKYQYGLTLEEVLLHERDRLLRDRHLNNTRNILDYLYSKGIIWGDFAPRNIIVTSADNTYVYTILDFEKTKVLTEPVPSALRVEHCRGPMCIEEFGAICTQEEVENCFKDYFEPGRWDINSTAKVPYEKPKRELEAIFIGRRKEKYNVGEYNSLELKVMKVRFPYCTSKSKLYFPLYTNFKIDHYLGADADRMTTEILMYARKHGLFVAALKVLNAAIEHLEDKLVAADFEAVIAERKFSNENKDCFEYHMLKNIVGRLYDSIQTKGQFQKALTYCDKEVKFYKSKLEVALTKSGNCIASQNFQSISKPISDLLNSHFKEKVELIFIFGGVSRGELTYGSDIDIGIVGNDGSIEQARSSLENKSKERLGMGIEIFPIHSLVGIDSFVRENPDAFLDICEAKVIFATPDCSEKFQKLLHDIRSSCLLQLKAIQFYYCALKNTEVNNIRSVKLSLHAINFLKSVYGDGQASLPWQHILEIKDFLNYVKNEYYFDKEYNLYYYKLPDDELVLIYQELGSILYSLQKVLENDANGVDLYGLVSNFIETNTKQYAETAASEKEQLFYPSIIPKNQYIFFGKGAEFTTTQGHLIDFGSMTANCILGQNDPWIKANLLAYSRTGSPSFHSSSLGSRLYYSYPKRLKNLKIGGIEDARINHRQCNGSDVVELAVMSACMQKRNRKYFISS